MRLIDGFAEFGGICILLIVSKRAKEESIFQQAFVARSLSATPRASIAIVDHMHCAAYVLDVLIVRAGLNELVRVPKPLSQKSRSISSSSTPRLLSCSHSNQ